MQRQRPLRTEQAAERYRHPRLRAPLALPEASQRRRGKRQRRLLREADRLVRRPLRFAQAGLRRVQGFDTPQRLIEVERPGLFLQR